MSVPTTQRTGPAGYWATRHVGIELSHENSYRVGVEPDALPDDIGIEGLVQPGLRRNKRRAHLLVSTVLGKHLPTDPRVVLDAGNRLGDLVRVALDADDAVVLGFAETATGLGHCVAARIEAACYLHSTRRVVPEAATVTGFEEGHSHATSHMLQPVRADVFASDVPLVLVDDEISTGNTAIDAIRALHAFAPRTRYVLASLVDMRTADDRTRFAAAGIELGVQIDTVCLAAGTTMLPDSAVGRVLGLPEPELNPVAEQRGSFARLELPWPAAVPEGGRHGVLRSETPAFEEAVGCAAEVVRQRLTADYPGRPVIVLGHEELMYLPLRLAVALADHRFPVRYQTTTRSPAYVLDEPGYPLRRGFCFTAPEADQAAPRFLYNAYWTDEPFAAMSPETATELEATRRCGVEAAIDEPHDAHSDPVLLVIIDSPADTDHLAAEGGLIDVLTDSGASVLLAVLPEADPRRLDAVRSPSTGRPEPLFGPEFGSYARDDVTWLLTDLSAVELEAETVYREKRIQTGVAHYAESLPIEYQPDARYRELFDQVLAESADRLALAVGTVSELVLAERGSDIVLASLARAGTPVGILMRRWLARQRNLDIAHYAVSIVRDRGIDSAALDYLAREHDPESVVFVDGWTGKGAIAAELSDALAAYHAAGGPRYNEDLAVLADPGHCVRTYGTRDDFLIASACLNSTVSGLVSRTVLNRELLGHSDFHGAKYYRELAADDVSARLIDTVAGSFDAVAGRVGERVAELRASARTPTWAGWSSVERVRAEYGIDSVNFVKPGVGETTRVLLRRVPWRVLVREADAPEHAHIRLLAESRGVPVEVVDDLAYSCMGLIKDLQK